MLDSLNETNDKFEALVVDSAKKAEEMEDDFRNKIIYAQEKIAELHDICGKLEHSQVVYIAHRADHIDQILATFINKYPERKKMKIMFLRESEGVYKFG